MVDRYLEDGRVPANLEVVACHLGVGKNMAKSMRAWGRAAGVLDDEGQITALAKMLFVRFDPFLERGESVAFLHWQIASNIRRLTAGVWVFNRLLDDQFTMSDAVAGFIQYLASTNSEYAEGTLRGDIEPVLRMHTPAVDGKNEDIGDRFFAQLGLLGREKAERRQVFKRTWANERVHVTDRIIEHALLSSLAKRRTASSALSALYLTRETLTCPGTVFGLTKDGFFSSVERICRQSDHSLALATMPGEDALLTARGSLAEMCAGGDSMGIDSLFFDRAN